MATTSPESNLPADDMPAAVPKSQSKPEQPKPGRGHAGSGPDILNGSLWKAVPLFAVPVALTGILEQLANLVGVVVIGQLSGPNGTVGMAAVGSNTPIVSLVVNLFIGIALGANVVIAHAVGRGDQASVEKAVHSSIVASLVGVALAVLGEAVADPLLRLLNCPDEALSDAVLYLRIFLVGAPAVLLYNFEAAIFRSVGITKMPLQALALSTAVCALLDLLFVPVLGWGVAGVAVAAVVGYVLSAVLLFMRLLHTDAPVRVDPRKLRVDRHVLARIVRIGMPAGLQGAVFSVSNIIIQAAINSLGTEVVAASSAALSLEFVCYNLLSCYGQACTTFVGQNFGARRLDRCTKTLKVCLVEGALTTLVSVGTVILLGRQIVACFNGDPVVVELGYLRICTIFPAYAFSMAYENMSGYLRGFGISLLPALLTMLGVCGIRILWVAFVFPTSPTFATVMAVYPLSLGTTALLILGAALFCRPARMYARRERGTAGGKSETR